MSETVAISDAIGWLKRFLEALLGHAEPRNDSITAPGTAVPRKIVLAPVLTPSSSVGILLTPTLLRKLGANDPEIWAPVLVAACAEFAITTPRRIAAFLANILTETGGFTSLVESLNYST